MSRVGIGYDLHVLVEGRPLILGGVRIPYEKGLKGHSDADALAHAIIDAALGAAALGNIGQHFPDTDPHYKDADSMELLRITNEKLKGAGWNISNIDSNIIAQAPRLAPYLNEMRKKIAEIVGIDIGAVSVKAKTNEGVGAEGGGEAISTQAVVLIQAVASL